MLARTQLQHAGLAPLSMPGSLAAVITRAQLRTPRPRYRASCPLPLGPVWLLALAGYKADTDCQAVKPCPAGTASAPG